MIAKVCAGIDNNSIQVGRVLRSSLQEVKLVKATSFPDLLENVLVLETGNEKVSVDGLQAYCLLSTQLGSFLSVWILDYRNRQHGSLDYQQIGENQGKFTPISPIPAYRAETIL